MTNRQTAAVLVTEGLLAGINRIESSPLAELITISKKTRLSDKTIAAIRCEAVKFLRPWLARLDNITKRSSRPPQFLTWENKLKEIVEKEEKLKSLKDT